MIRDLRSVGLIHRSCRLETTGMLIFLATILLSFVLQPINGLASVNNRVCDLSIAAGDNMQFSKSEMSVSALCEIVTVTLVHTGKLPKVGMGHNWVLTRKADFRNVAADGVSAGLASHFVKEGDARVVAFTELIGGGESISVSFSTKGMEVGDEFIFFCSYPGHWGIMKGAFLFTQSLGSMGS